VVSGNLVLLKIKEKEMLYLVFWSQKTHKKQKELLLQKNSREAKS
jgi:hypothetical protein